MRKLIVAIVVAASIASPAEADGGKRKRNWPQEDQNRAADRYDLTRLKDLKHLKRFIAAGILVRVPDRTDAYYLETIGEFDPDNADAYAHVRSYAKLLLDVELGAVAAKNGGPLKVVGLARTRAYQRKVCRHYASAICGGRWWQQSSHLTGATVDISFDGMTREVKAQLGRRFRKLQRQGKVIFITEYGCYHVMVLPTYAKATKAKPAKKAKKPRKAKKPKKSRHRRRHPTRK